MTDLFLAVSCCERALARCIVCRMQTINADIIMLAKVAYASSMPSGPNSGKRCTLPVLKLAAQTRSTGLNTALIALDRAGLVEHRARGGWVPTEAGIAKLTAHVGEPVFAE